MLMEVFILGLAWLAADIILIAPFAYVSWKRYPEREREEQINAQLEVA